MSVRIEHGDCLKVMKRLADEGVQVDGVCCDPPYHLSSIVKRFGKVGSAPAKSNGATGVYGRAAAGFMGQKWDGGDVAFRPETWQLVAALLKPGGHMLVFGGTRTYHRVACAIEDAGFEIRDAIMWHYGSGFPKSHDVSKGIDKARRRDYVLAARDLGLAIPGNSFHDWTKAEHSPSDAWWEKFKSVIATEDWQRIERRVIGQRAVHSGVAFTSDGPTELDITAPATDAAEQWDGWGTALKPATEIICLARKPLSEKTVAANVLRWGTGALNIDGCRVGTFKNTMPPGTDRFNQANHEHGYRPNAYQGNGRKGEASADQRYTEKGSTNFAATPGPRGGAANGRWPANCLHDGSAEVLEAFPAAPGQQRTVGPEHGEKASVNVYGDYGPRDTFPPRNDSGTAARFFYCAKADKADRLQSKHPTVKPVDLIAYLCRLITPSGGCVLDPFAGSGTTAMACLREGFDAILIEKEEEYCRDIQRRIMHVRAADTPLFSSTSAEPQLDRVPARYDIDGTAKLDLKDD